MSDERYPHVPIALSAKAAKLIKLCDAEGFNCIDDLLAASITDSVCPAICMPEGCDYRTEMEPDPQEGYREACGGNVVFLRARKGILESSVF
jgi:hypothetical protein